MSIGAELTINVSRRYRCGERSGQVLVVLLLGITFLAGLILYVINVGDQINRRQAMQNAADSTAVSGSAWMARSMNVIAGNNVAITRMLALVPHLDSYPLATQMTHQEVAAWEKGIADQLGRGIPDDWMREGLESLRLRITKQRDILGEIDNVFNNSGFDVAPLTNWSIQGYAGPTPHGQLWQAAESLDEFNQATVLSAGLLSQTNAARYGKSDYAETAFITPVLPELPARRTDFGDFEKPVKQGVIPDRSYPHRLGPYDRLFMWRDYHYSGVYEQDCWVDGTPGHGAIRGGSGNVNIGGRRYGSSARGYYRNPDGYWSNRLVGRILTGYTVYGPYSWMMRRVGSFSSRELPDTFFYHNYLQIANIKLGYMWGDKTLKEIHYPRWWTDYPQAKVIASDPSNKITRTMFYLVEIRSKYPKGSSGWLSTGSYKTNGERPIAIWVNGWADPAEWSVPKIADYIWEDQYYYETTEDRDIDIRVQYDANGEPVWQKVYMVAQYVFGGIDAGGNVQVSNPSNYCNTCHDESILPAPILLDTSAGDYDTGQPHHDLGVRRGVFTYLGVAGRSSEPMVWAGRFGSGNPFGQVVAVSQAEIFNTTSWDLWTQDWKAQLVPVTRWNDWTERMADGAADASATTGLVEPQTVSDFAQYLGRFDEQIVNEMLHH
ncbi:MAG: Tad domain-containing protein [Planctomycetota bacterium]|nr:Tad domain-containing protein [Planctomycetota bacterium]